MLAWSEGTDNGRQKNQKSCSCNVVRELSCYWLLRSHSQACAKPKLKSTGAGCYQLLSRWWDAYRKQLGLRASLPKSQDAVALQQIKGVALYLWLIVVISVRQSTVAAISGLHCRALVMVSSSIKADSLIAKFKEAGGTVREIDVWAESPRLSPLWLSASSSACHGLLLIITVITPLRTAKPSATKMPENWSWRTRQLLTCRCVSVMLLRSMQNTRRS